MYQLRVACVIYYVVVSNALW